MYIVTGGSGFIGSRLIKKLNDQKINNIILVDKKKNKFEDIKFHMFVHSSTFINNIDKFLKKKIKCIFHLGANSRTTENNLKSILNDNYNFSLKVIEKATQFKIPIIYASSASVYGTKEKHFDDDNIFLRPENYYSLTKSMVDTFVIDKLSNNKKNKIIGLRFFNVYGPGEEFKNEMSSVVYKMHKHFKKFGFINLFKGSHGYKNGDQRRDFIYITDCVDIMLWFNKNFKPGIYNLGTGNARTFNNVAKIFLNYYGDENLNKKIRYVKFPKSIKNSYQSFTKANISKLRKAGYKKNFVNINNGIINYLNYLEKKN